MARFSLSTEMSRLTQDGTAELVSNSQARTGTGKYSFSVQLTTSRDWQHYPADQYSAIFSLIGHNQIPVREEPY